MNIRFSLVLDFDKYYPSDDIVIQNAKLGHTVTGPDQSQIRYALEGLVCIEDNEPAYHDVKIFPLGFDDEVGPGTMAKFNYASQESEDIDISDFCPVCDAEVSEKKTNGRDVSIKFTCGCRYFVDHKKNGHSCYVLGDPCPVAHDVAMRLKSKKGK